MAHGAGLLGFGADHDARRVAEREQRDAVGIAQAHEIRRLAGGRAVDRAGQAARVVGEHPQSLALDPDERGDEIGRVGGAEFGHRIRIRECGDDAAHVVGHAPVIGHGRADRRRVARRVVGDIALEIGQAAFCGGHRFGLVIDDDIHHADGGLLVGRADVLGREIAETTAGDHGRPGHAEIGIAGRDGDIATAEERRIAGKTAPRVDADQRHLAAQTRERIKAGDFEAGAGDERSVHVARPAPAALGEKHHGQAIAQGDIDHAVGLAVILEPLGAGQHGVVVAHHHAAGGGRVEGVAVDATDAAHESVGGRVALEVIDRAATALGRDRQRAVLEKAVGIA